MSPDPPPSQAMTDVQNVYIHKSDAQMNIDNSPMDEGDVAIMLGTQLIQAILNNAPFDEIKDLVKTIGAPVWYQDETEGMSALHAAAYVRRPDVAKFLIREGAVWNAGACQDHEICWISAQVPANIVDYLKNTAGDIALSFNDEETYTLVRDAGIRSGSCLQPSLPSRRLITPRPTHLITPAALDSNPPKP